MITAIVQMALPKAVSRDEAKAMFESTAPRYRDLPGLMRKNYLLSEDGRTAGGAYLWQSREAAEAVYDAEWRARIRELYGSDPVVTYYESPVVVDNGSGEIITD